MDLRTRAAAYGIAGLLISGIAIFAGSVTGSLSVPAGGFNPSSPGFLSIMLTDPPSVPANVTAVYLDYSNLGVHAYGFGDAGWVWTGTAGTIETMSLVNLSQTISAGTVPSGNYNAVAFLVSSAKILYNGVNYTATLNGGRLVATIPGGLEVNSTVPAGALIDLSPVVLNVGTQSSPDFVVTTAARALQVPRGEFVQEMRHLGFRMPLAERGWFRSFIAAHSDNISASSVTFSSTSLSLSVTSPGTDSSTVRVIILSPSASVNVQGRLGALASSFVFAVQPDGSLQLVSFNQMSRGNMISIHTAMATPGFTLAAGASKTFTYSGAITTLLTDQGINRGSTYYVRVFGPATFGVQSVVAS